jgi:carbamoyl-phosphate synthase large subunit
VVKERRGAGSRSIGIGLDRSAALRHAQQLAEPIFQPLVEGREISVDAWLDRHGRVKGTVLRNRERVEHGESVVTATFRDVRLESEVTAVLQALQLRGPVVLQAIVDSRGAPHVIEVNARFGGASTAGIAAGLDPWYWSLLELQGSGLDSVAFERVPGEIRQVRVSADVICHDPDL